MSGPTVFVIETDAAVRDSLRVLLECEGIVARTYDCAAAFLSEVRPQRNSCIVADVHLSGSNGLDFLDELDQRGIAMPVIVTTSRKVTDCLHSSIGRVGATLLEKPYDPRQLVTNLRRVLDLD